jgi:hypothetical protein
VESRHFLVIEDTVEDGEIIEVSHIGRTEDEQDRLRIPAKGEVVPRDFSLPPSVEVECAR